MSALVSSLLYDHSKGMTSSGASRKLPRSTLTVKLIYCKFHTAGVLHVSRQPGISHVERKALTGQGRLGANHFLKMMQIVRCRLKHASETFQESFCPHCFRRSVDSSITRQSCQTSNLLPSLTSSSRLLHVLLQFSAAFAVAGQSVCSPSSRRGESATTTKRETSR